MAKTSSVWKSRSYLSGGGCPPAFVNSNISLRDRNIYFSCRGVREERLPGFLGRDLLISG